MINNVGFNKDPEGYPAPPEYERPPPNNPGINPGFQQQQPPPMTFSNVSYQSPQQQGYNIQQQRPFFDENAPKYKCCCCCHAKCGSVAIGIWEILGALLGLIGNFTHGYRVNVGSSIIPFAVTVLVVGLMFYGIRSTRCGFLITHMVFQVLAIIAFVIVIIIGIVAVAGSGSLSGGYSYSYSNSWTQEDAQTLAKWIGIILIIAGAVWACLEIWFFVVVLRCYRYLRDKRLFSVMSVHPVVGFGIAPTIATVNGPSIMTVY